MFEITNSTTNKLRGTEKLARILMKIQPIVSASYHADKQIAENRVS